MYRYLAYLRQHCPCGKWWRLYVQISPSSKAIFFCVITVNDTENCINRAMRSVSTCGGLFAQFEPKLFFFTREGTHEKWGYGSCSVARSRLDYASSCLCTRKFPDKPSCISSSFCQGSFYYEIPRARPQRWAMSSSQQLTSCLQQYRRWNHGPSPQICIQSSESYSLLQRQNVYFDALNGCKILCYRQAKVVIKYSKESKLIRLCTAKSLPSFDFLIMHSDIIVLVFQVRK
jgi:hypothetical protein